MYEALTSVLHINEIVCWSDSLVNLYWIKGFDKDYKQFVENRVSEIRETTEMQQWWHCLGILNPVDIPTRGMSASEFANSELWFHGPEFIRKPKEFWTDATSSDIKEAPSEVLIEEKVKVVNLLTTKTEKPQPRVNLEQDN